MALNISELARMAEFSSLDAKVKDMAKAASGAFHANAAAEAVQRNIALSNQFQDTIDKYTHGRLVTEAERRDAMLKEMAKVAPNAFHANTPAEAAQRNFELSNQHQDAIDKLTLGISATKPSFTEPMPGELNYRLMEPHIPKNPIHETNEKLGNVVEQIEDLRPMAAQAAQLIRSMNDTALEMQAKYIENAKIAGRQTRFAIWIAAVSLAISSFFSYQSYVDAKVSGVKSDNQINAFQEEIRNLVTAQSEERAALVKAIGDARRVPPATVKK